MCRNVPKRKLTQLEASPFCPVFFLPGNLTAWNTDVTVASPATILDHKGTLSGTGREKEPDPHDS